MTDFTRDELLTLLIEECAEVIQCATKCQRFGEEYRHPTYYDGKTNLRALTEEMGDVMGVVRALELDADAMFKSANTKMQRAKEAREKAK